MPNIEATVALTVSERKGKKESAYRDEKGNYAWFHAYFFQYWWQRGTGRARPMRSFDLDDPPSWNKILYNPDIPWIGLRFATLSLKANDRPTYFAYLWNSKSVHARVHMFQVCSLRSVHGKMVWGMVELCDILQDPHSLLPPTCSRTGKAFPSTTGELFRLWTTYVASPLSLSFLFLLLCFFSLFFVFSSPYKGDGRITALPDISVIMRFGVVICECENSSTKGTMISIWKIL